jgi:hypothetical protein
MTFKYSAGRLPAEALLDPIGPQLLTIMTDYQSESTCRTLTYVLHNGINSTKRIAMVPCSRLSAARFFTHSTGFVLTACTDLLGIATL